MITSLIEEFKALYNLTTEDLLHGYCHDLSLFISQNIKGSTVVNYMGYNELQDEFLVHSMIKIENQLYDAQGLITDVNSYLEDYEEMEDIETEFYFN
ncbi:hypothetical protein, partial [Staphylococcus phage Stab23]